MVRHDGASRVSTTILDRLNTEINRILQNRSINEGFAAQSLEAIRMGRAELDAYLCLSLANGQRW